jgi:Ca2+-transporting ATPase
MTSIDTAEAPAVAHPERLTADEVVRALGSDPVTGLTSEEAARRLERVGRNQLPAPRGTPLVTRVANQLREPLSLLLLGAAAVSGIALREVVDALAIAAIVLLNAVIAIVEEGRAASALAALRSLEVPEARVRRDGRDRLLPAPELVPGDLVVLEAGDRVPADLRLLSGHGLEIDESLLTGESLPAAKEPGEQVDEGAALGERRNMAFSGTFVVRGTGRGVVVATGPHTTIGAIARDIAQGPRPTPLQLDLAQVTRRLGAVCIAIAGVVLGITLWRSGLSAEALEEAFLAAIALAVAAVPEGLATVTAVGLALGVRRMAERGAIIRRLPAVETLGSATVLATDKTGTLTENRMVLEGVAPPDGDFRPLEEVQGVLRELIERVAALCNDADLDPPVGDPTDIALLDALGRRRVDELRAARPRVAATPFDSERKRETTVHRGPDGSLELYVKGAQEVVLPSCATAAVLPKEDDRDWRERVLATGEEAARRGIRVLAFARRRLDEVPRDPDTAGVDLEFIALAGLRDPVRESAARSVAEVRSAGITLLMATGDHPGTAAAIAEEVGLASPPVRVVTGRELRSRGFGDDPTAIPVYARVDPDQKLELVRRLQDYDAVVGMTGDGVNDAPALRRADIGIALGRRGSDVAREAADMVITDDDLATIVLAVREGRGVYDNVRKVVDYLVTGNLAEVLVVLTGLLFIPELGVPLFPLQLLWINLITDGMPAVALGVDPPDRGLMRRPPRPRDQRLLGWERLRILLLRSLVITAASLAALLIARYVYDVEWDRARAVLFSTLVVAGLLYSFVVRRGTGLMSNRWLLLAVAGGFAAQLLIVYLPAAGVLFETVPHDLREWGLILACGAVPSLLLAMLPVPGRASAPQPDG